VLDAFASKHLSQILRPVYGHRTHQHGPVLFMILLNFIYDSIEFGLFRFIYIVCIILPHQRFVGGYNQYLKLVYLVEFLSFGDCSTGHAGQFGVQTEVILERYGGHSKALSLYLNALFGLYGLMQSLRVATPEHESAGEIVDYHHLAIFYHIVAVFSEDDVCLECGFHISGHFVVCRIIYVIYAQQFFYLGNAGFQNAYGL